MSHLDWSIQALVLSAWISYLFSDGCTQQKAVPLTKVTSGVWAGSSPPSAFFMPVLMERLWVLPWSIPLAT